MVFTLPQANPYDIAAEVFAARYDVCVDGAPASSTSTSTSASLIGEAIRRGPRLRERLKEKAPLLTLIPLTIILFREIRLA
jgi:hypothetical protein